MIFHKNNKDMHHHKLFKKDWIVNKAKASLNKKPVHITSVKASMSEGGIHDFYSNGDYWWPNPNTSDGLPYIRKDGETNPQCFIAHRLILREMRTHVANLAAGYKITGDEKYAKKAVEMLKTFFLDELTKMNPHLLYAQAIPGICSGRGIGIIDTLHLIDVPVAIYALKESKYLTSKLLDGFKTWFANYLKWMTTHPYGLDEMNEKNNHGICWYVQAAVFAKFTCNMEMIEFCRESYKNILVPEQMALDGSFPRELERTKPYAYSIFALDNMVTLCHTLSDEQNNLWTFELKDGRGIKKGLAYLLPYLEYKARWPYMNDIQHFEQWPVAMSFMPFAGYGINSQEYIDLWKRLNNEPTDMEVRRNMAIRQPYLWLL